MASYVPAPVPDDRWENERLAQLYRLGILDTAVEERFDRITQFVADIFDVPIAFISFVDRNRQWIKSSCNFPVSETGRDISLCGHTILEPEMLVVPDAAGDPRFAGNPLVTGAPHIRFYAGAVLRGPGGHALGTLCLIDHAPRDISARERARLLNVARLVEQELHHDQQLQEISRQAFHNANYDPVTGLPNGILFLDRVNQAITLARRSSHCLMVALVALRPLADTLAIVSKETGERLLRACGERLSQHLNPACTVARWRDDQFAILAPKMLQVGEADALQRMLLAAFIDPVRLDTAFHFDALCGAALYPYAAIDADSLAAGAAMALRTAQRDPHSPARIHTSEASTAVTRQLRLENNLRGALQGSGLDVLYQPIVDIDTGAIVAVEALVRWQDPVHGSIPTDEFIRVAEESILVSQVDQFVLTQVARDFGGWDATARERLSVSINLSGRTLLRDDFIGWLQSNAGGALAPSRVILEVTENYLVADLERAAQNIRMAHDLGYRFAVDDFGTGFSSFDYLTNLPIQLLKLDRSFVYEIAQRSARASVAQTIVNLARNLGIPLVAEGIETYEQLIYLKAYKCDHGQGYYFSRPVTAGYLEHLLAADTRLPGDPPHSRPG